MLESSWCADNDDIKLHYKLYQLGQMSGLLMRHDINNRQKIVGIGHKLMQRHLAGCGSVGNDHRHLDLTHIFHAYWTLVLITSPLVNDFVLPFSSSIIKPPSLAICLAVPLIV